MAGRFEGLSDLEWKLFEDAFLDLASIHIWIQRVLLVG
jgi:hypothetical protein